MRGRRPNRLRRTPAALVLLVLIACSVSPLGVSRDELRDAETRWRLSAIASYDFVVQRGCFCGPAVTRPVTAQVRDGAFAALVYADSGTAADTSLFTDVLTVDRLHGLIERALAQSPAAFSAVYDPFFGYPTRLVVDPNAAIADDELTITVTGFTRR